MPWVSQPVQDRFYAFLGLMNVFRENYATQENTIPFQTIARICENIARFFDANEPPDEADTKLSSLSNAIQTQLPRLASMILTSQMKEDDESFQMVVLDRMVRITTELNRLVSLAEKDLAKLQKMPLSPREVDTGFLRTNSSVHVSGEMIQERIALLYEVPQRLIVSVHSSQSESDHSSDEDPSLPLLERPIPAEIQTSSSCFAFFNRALQTCTKTMLSGVSLGTLGTGYLGLSYLSQYLGNDLDNLIKADQTGLNHKIIIAVLLMLSSVTLCSVALVRSRYHSTQEPERDIESARYLTA